MDWKFIQSQDDVHKLHSGITALTTTTQTFTEMVCKTTLIISQANKL